MFRVLRSCKSNHLCPLIGKKDSKMSSQVANNPASTEDVQDNVKRPLDEPIESLEVKKAKIERIKKKNFALMLGYLGKDYYGMQRNPNMKTIEEDLFTALLKAKLIDDESFAMIQNTNFQRAARTDKGVSATRQICSVKLPDYAKIEDINAFLPEQIRVFGLKRVTKGFNSKSHCNARTYSYTLPTFAFAPDDTTLMERVPLSDEDIAKRIEQLSVIDEKPYTDFRMSPELKERINTVLKLYEGSHNFHNFTAKVRPFDPRAHRYIIKCEILETHLSKDGVEFATLLIKGQSFMLHQIRKMVAFVIAVVRNLVKVDAMEEAFNPEKWDIAITPGLGLVLNHVHYDNYNRRYGADGIHENLEWTECDEEVQKFHKKYILSHIEDTEFTDRSMLLWLANLGLHKFGTRSVNLEDQENIKDGEDNND